MKSNEKCAKKYPRRFFNLRILSFPCEKFHFSGTISVLIWYLTKYLMALWQIVRISLSSFQAATWHWIIFALKYWFNLRLRRIQGDSRQTFVHFYDRPFVRARKVEWKRIRREIPADIFSTFARASNFSHEKSYSTLPWHISNLCENESEFISRRTDVCRLDNRSWHLFNTFLLPDV